MLLRLYKLFNFIVFIIALMLLIIFMSEYFMWEDMDTPRNLEKIVYTFIFILMISLPDIVAKRYQISKPLIFVSNLFWTMQLLLGSIGNLYVTTPFWDIIMHTFAILFLEILAFDLWKYLKIKREFTFKQKLLMICGFAFCMGLAWETGEFVLDRMYDLNLQRYRNEITQVPYVGFWKYVDTIKDICVDAVAVTVFGFLKFYDHKNKNYYEQWFFTNKVTK